MGKDGKDFEHLVRLVEASISPDSVVEHNVKLPVIGSSGKHTRQCDVVIRTGPKARETVTIVEVQDRLDKKTEIGDLGDWLYKLEQVGAQHLICVSRHEFPTSIKDEAVRHGNTVRLITVKELSAEKIPINIEFNHQKFELTECNAGLTTSKSELEGLGIRDAVKERIEGSSQWEVNEQIWSLDKTELVSLFILCRENFVRPEKKKEGEGKIVFDIKEGPELYMYLEDHFFRIGLECDFSWTFEETEIPITVLTYEQNEAGILAWIAEISYESPKGLISTKFPIIEIDEGFRIDGMLVTMPSGSTLTVGVRSPSGRTGLA